MLMDEDFPACLSAVPIGTTTPAVTLESPCHDLMHAHVLLAFPRCTSNPALGDSEKQGLHEHSVDSPSQNGRARCIVFQNEKLCDLGAAKLQ